MTPAEAHFREFIQWRWSGPTIVLVLLLYGYLVNKVGAWAFQRITSLQCAKFDILKEFRQLSLEMLSLSIPILGQACFSKNSDLNIKLAQLGHLNLNQDAVKIWIILLYLIFLASPLIFVRFSLLEVDHMKFKNNRNRVLFLWTTTTISWLLGFISLEVALNLLRDGTL